MKKVIRTIFVGVFAFISLVTCSSCGTELTTGDVETIFNDALALTAEQTVFYWEETIIDDDESSYRQVSSYAEKDTDGNIVFDEDGEYSDRKIQVTENINQKTVLEIYCGLSEADDKSEEIDLLFVTEYDENQNITSETIEEMSPREFYESESFEKYLPVNVLSELYSMTVSDMNFDIEDGAAETNGYVTELTFMPTDEYLENFEMHNGEKSMFDGADKVFVEISYGRIASLVIYSEYEIKGSELTYEQEDYTFQIVYLGPKFDIPTHSTEIGT